MNHLERMINVNVEAVTIFIKGEDLTHQIDSYKIEPKSILVKFINQDKFYSYSKSNVEIIEHTKKYEDCKSPYQFLKEVVDIVGLKSEDGHNFLKSHYEKRDFIRYESILFSYFEDIYPKEKLSLEKAYLFPFAFNLSQAGATTNAINSRLSIIEGPPGTGKTQTILNIISNIVMREESVAVASNNNSAVENILEKLNNYGVGFMAASLGKAENRENFINNQTIELPQMKSWKLDFIEELAINATLKKDLAELNNMLQVKNKISKLTTKLDKLLLEQKHYNNSFNDNIKAYRFKFLAPLQSSQALKLWSFCEHNANRYIWFFTKIKNIFRFKIYDFYFYKIPANDQISLCQTQFYRATITELNQQLSSLKEKLLNFSFEAKMEKYSALSMQLFKSFLSKKYAKTKRIIFEREDLWQNSDQFIKHYPVVLSTTHSLRNSLNYNHLYDYVIIDEASQVDIATGSLALSCAKKGVIVGDLKQLNHIVNYNDKMIIDSLFTQKYKLHEAFNYSKYNILSSLITLFPNVPRTLLREHYRCHPQIINFCNSKFYDDELIILSNQNSNVIPLAVYKTSIGNHARDNFNQREIDVIRNEVFPQLNLDPENESIGIVTPYNHQRNVLQHIFSGTKVEADTVDKYQGREKDNIIISTVDNNITPFVDDPLRMNVAISRAIKRLILVTNSNDEKPSNIQDLIKYIKYNNYEITESKIYSVFDYLYGSYEQERKKYLSQYKKVSQYESENLAFSVISDVLKGDLFIKLDLTTHVPLKMIIRDFSKLTKKEIKYASNILTHIDFLIFEKLGKTPVMAIEVDGTSFHKKGSRQEQRDIMKNNILEKYAIPLLRLRTNESQEKERITKALKESFSF